MSEPAPGIFQNVVKLSPFPATSRYYQTETATLETPERKIIVYVRRRFVPHGA